MVYTKTCNTGTHKLLEIKDLSLAYSSTGETILSRISTTIKSGQFVLIAGSSGSGKSSLINCINGVVSGLKQTTISGDITLDGKSLFEKNVAERAKIIGSVLQNPDDQIIFENIEDEVAFPLENLAVKPEDMADRITQALQFMHLDLNTDPTNLSGGEKQSLITAVTLAMKQRILLFDEPLANLDHNSALELLHNLKELCQKYSYTVILAEHRLDWILPFIDKVLWLDQAKLQEFQDISLFKKYWDDQILKSLQVKQNYSAKQESLTKDGENHLSDNDEKKTVLFKLENISLSYNKRLILNNINLTLKRDDNWVMIGDNGSGKSTLVSILSGLTKPDQGRVYCIYPKRKKFKKIGVIMQNPNYQLFMPTVYQEISFQSISEKRTKELIAAFELGGLEDRHPQSLSEGQKRKIGVAAILTMNPEVLFFDEPTVGQDYHSLALIIEELERMKLKQSLTTITITHDWRCAASLGNKIIWMENGKIKRSGSLDLLDQYRQGPFN